MALVIDYKLIVSGNYWLSIVLSTFVYTMFSDNNEEKKNIS